MQPLAKCLPKISVKFEANPKATSLEQFSTKKRKKMTLANCGKQSAHHSSYKPLPTHHVFFHLFDTINESELLANLSKLQGFNSYQAYHLTCEKTTIIFNKKRRINKYKIELVSIITRGCGKCKLKNRLVQKQAV